MSDSSAAPAPLQQQRRRRTAGFPLSGWLLLALAVYCYGYLGYAGVSALYFRALGPERSSSAPAVETSGGGGRVRANRASGIYHLPGCPNYRDLAERNVALFESAEEAERAGFRKSRNCPN